MLCNVGEKGLDGGRMEQMLSVSLPHARVNIEFMQPGFHPALCRFLPLGLMARSEDGLFSDCVQWQLVV